MKKCNAIRLASSCVIVLFTVVFFSSFGFSADNVEESQVDKADIITITGEDIAQLKVHSMVDLLNTIPGINASKNMVKFRGFNTKKILVLLDGREINDPTSSMRIVNWNRISVTDIEKVEILKGGAGGLYGDHAAGGLIRISTKKIENGVHGNIEGGVGSFNSQWYEGIINRKAGSFGLNLSGKWDTTDGARSNSGEREYGVGGRLQYFRSSDDAISLASDYSYSNAEKSGPLYRLTPNAQSQEETLGVSLVMPWDTLKSETHFNLFDNSYVNPDSNYVSQMQYWSLKERLVWSSSFASVGIFDFGMDLALEHVAGLNIPSLVEKNIGLYVGRKFSVDGFPTAATPFTVNFGLRVNLHSEFPAAFNPNLQIMYAPEWANVTLTAERFSTTPTFRRRFYNTSTLRGNPDLKAENGTNYSLGLSRKILKSAELSVSFFYNQVDDRIVYERRGEIGTYENIGSSVKKGFESSVKWEPNKQIRLTCSYTWLNAKNQQTGKFLTYTPEHEILMDMGITPFPDLFVGAVIKYKSTSYYNSVNLGSLAGTYFRFGLRAEYSFMEKYALFARVDNVLDAEFHVIDGYPVTPRNFRVGLTYGF